MTPMERYMERLGKSGQISRREDSWDLAMESAVDAVVLFVLCCAGVLSGAVFVVLVWGWI